MLSKYQRNQCLICFERLSNGANFMQLLVYDDLICPECRSKFSVRVRQTKFNNYKLYSIYQRNKWSDDLLRQYKDLGDEALAPVFLYPFIKKLKRRYKKFSIITTSSNNRQPVGFDYMAKMFKECNFETNDIAEWLNKSKELEKNSEQILLVSDCLNKQLLNEAITLLKKHCQQIEILTVMI